MSLKADIFCVATIMIPHMPDICPVVCILWQYAIWVICRIYHWKRPLDLSVWPPEYCRLLSVTPHPWAELVSRVQSNSVSQKMIQAQREDAEDWRKHYGSATVCTRGMRVQACVFQLHNKMRNMMKNKLFYVLSSNVRTCFSENVWLCPAATAIFNKNLFCCGLVHNLATYSIK